MMVNNELEMMWKNAIVAVGAEENHKIPPSGLSVSGSNEFKLETFPCKPNVSVSGLNSFTEG
jgi:hypothetical protein